MNSGTELVPKEILDKIQELEVLDEMEVISANVSQLTIIFVIIAVAVLIVGASALLLLWMYFRLLRGTRKKEVETKKDPQLSSVAVNIQSVPESPKEVQVPLRKFHSLPRRSTYQHAVFPESTKPHYMFPSKTACGSKNLSSSLMPINSCAICSKNNEYRHIQPIGGPLKNLSSFYGDDITHDNVNPLKNTIKRSHSFCRYNELHDRYICKNLQPLSTFGSFSQNNTNLHMKLAEKKMSSEGINSQTIGCKFPETGSFKPYFLKREF